MRCSRNEEERTLSHNLLMSFSANCLQSLKCEIHWSCSATSTILYAALRWKEKVPIWNSEFDLLSLQYRLYFVYSFRNVVEGIVLDDMRQRKLNNDPRDGAKVCETAVVVMCQNELAGRIEVLSPIATNYELFPSVSPFLKIYKKWKQKDGGSQKGRGAQAK